MLVCLACRALRSSGLSVALAVLAWLVLAPVPAQADVCSVGFTEFTGTSSGGNTVHVYVENAIAASGHVHVH